MRPYLVLCAVVLMAVAAFGQQPGPRVYGSCLYGCPYVPLITTPEISQIRGNTSSTYSEPVWYQGGDAPLVSPDVHLYPEPIGHAGRPMHEEHEMREERAREEKHEGWIFFSGSEHTTDAVEASAAAKGIKKAGRVYTNEDVQRQNQKNGEVKLNGKSEKM